MAEMPDIVLSRLVRKSSKNSAHPDANLLAAFAERTLLERERAAVIAHLLECADCRECVALASAVEEEQTVGTALGASIGVGEWFREWRWILSSATACCVVATALLHYGEPPARVISAIVSSKNAGPQIVDALKSTPAVPVRVTLVRKKKIDAPPDNKTQPLALITAKKDVAEADIIIPPPSAQPPPETALSVRRLKAPQADAISSFVEPEREAATPREQTPSASAAKRFGVQAALAGRAPGFAPRIRGPEPMNLKSVTASARLLWSINASPDTAGNLRGVVERSKDAGQSWEVVPLSERASFRSVTTYGPDVWAGGSEGTLFHSADTGAHWTEIKIADENGGITGEIFRIAVRGPNQVTVTTASGEVWTSVDNGKRWARE
jgi:hypothetical protein